MITANQLETLDDQYLELIAMGIISDYNIDIIPEDDVIDINVIPIKAAEFISLKTTVKKNL